MSIKQQLTEDMKTAMRAKDKVRLSIIRMIKNEIDKREIDTRKELNDVESIEAVTSYKKVVAQQLEYANDANNDEKIEEYTFELSVVNEYLPQQLSEPEVEAIVQGLITANGFAGVKDKGALMKLLMPEVKGKADGKLVSDVVSKLLV
ncbi:GatB/YqeY domain-containing protein [Paenibacillus psychroresistens]|uniref:GatB/YqeY domain-containing protein n=1 Tax=Paenibacillus psychroresistens TaxID=1778678 RepID=A0A6B8RJG7_9BACL|nr:GatB/YqeY domain-containing protein [Paenibacillus psychroresistens]QGQ95722.1 GatB/YqeY domain-containing protein [Paenibacillus psychroresistens]